MDELFSKKKKIASLLWSVVKLNVEKLVSESNEFYTCREGFKAVIFLSFNTFSNIFFNFPFLSLLIITLFLLCEIHIK